MELPEDIRLISIRYESRCRKCGKSLRVGERAYWSRSSSKVWCIECATPPSPRVPRRRKERSSVPNELSGQQEEWQRICKYAQQCIEAEAARSLVQWAARNRLWFLHTGEERLVVGKVDSVPPPEHFGGGRSDRQPSVVYGWPTVVLIDRKRTPQTAPLFAVQADVGRDPDGRLTLHAAMNPEFNPAISSSGEFDLSVKEEIGDMVQDGLPFGDPDAFTELAGSIAKLLGLQVRTPINSNRLDSEVGPERGVYNAAVSVLAEWPRYTTGLIEEFLKLHDCADWSETAAAHLVPGAVVRKRRKRSIASDPLASPLKCSRSQAEALMCIRREPLTIVTGPPGTGKTQLVVNSVTNAWLDGEKVLVTSTNNSAVDVAWARAVSEVCPGLLVRTGNRNVRTEVATHIAAAQEWAGGAGTDVNGTRARLGHATAQRWKLLERMEQLSRLDSDLLEQARQIEEKERERQEVAMDIWPEGLAPDLAMDIPTIRARAQRLLRTWWFPRYRARRLRRKLGTRPGVPLDRLVDWARIEESLEALGLRFESDRRTRRQLAEDVGRPSTSLAEADRKWADTSLEVIRAEIAVGITLGNEALEAFGRSPARLDAFRRVVARSLKHLRGWACTSLSVNSNFPLESGLFDLVIIDEASQCSLAVVLPLAYRARRLAVVGDPHQLNPIVGIDHGMIEDIGSRFGFDNEDLVKRGIHHGQGSAFAAFAHAAGNRESILLGEHYRCHPHIARWFNRVFYRGELEVLTDVSDFQGPDRAIHWHDVPGEAVRTTKGSWINRQEAEVVARHIRDLVASGFGSLGVVVPFTAQARLIDRIARKQLGDNRLNDIDFVCDTVHKLQGSERDAILISPVLSPGMSRSATGWIEKERNLINVAVSRARRSLIVSGHPLAARLGSPTLASLRAHARDLSRRKKEPLSSGFRTDSESEQRLLDAMWNQDLSPLTKLDIEGYELDFALMEGGIKLDIEVDGDQHTDVRGRRRRSDLARDRVLSALGWTVLRIPAWRCHREMDRIIGEIREVRDRLARKTAEGPDSGTAG